MRRFSYPLLMLVLLSFACQKQDDIFPEVEIISPAAGSTFSYGDTIRVRARVEQKNGPVSVSVLSGSSVQPFGSEKVYETSGTLEYDLYYTDRYLEGGTYDLRFTAFHGENKTSDFVKINIKPLPHKLTGLAALCVSGMNRVFFWQDSLGQNHHQALAGDYTYMAYNPQQQQAVVAPERNGSLTGFKFDDFTPTFTRDNPEPQGMRQYRGLVSSGPYFYAFENTGRVLVVGEAGSLAHNFNLPQKKHLVRVAASKDYLLIAVKEEFAPYHELLLLRKQNGAVLKSQQVNGEPLFINALASGRFAVFLQKRDDTEIGEFNPGSGFYTKIITLKQQQVLAATALDNNTVAFSTTSGIYQFDLQSSTNPAQLYNFAADVLQYDEPGKQLYVAQGSVIKKARPGSSFVKVVVCPGSVLDFNLMYNK